jgi:ppGpp synthetase/RelA/SpoT-type nucleotidyltranferase
MTLDSGIPVLDDPQAAAKLSDQEWVELHVPRFKDGVRSRYLAYETFLKDVLTAFCRKAAPQAIVQTRAKGVPSFAEKILRKRASYTGTTDSPLPPDPLVRLTDLCGGRVIAQTAAQVKAVSQLIEQCFDIDWANSDDASTRLRTAEFGYRTINYIVMANPQKLAAAGIEIPVPQDVLASVRPEADAPVRLKAEIQVRTLLEHAYADIGHDLTYKTEVTVPSRIHRSFSAIAAVLETADKEFERLINSLSEFNSNYGAYHSRTQVEDEIARLRVVLSSDPANVAQAVRIANLALAIGNFECARDVLADFRTRTDQGAQQALGKALTHIHWDAPRSPEFQEGLAFLDAASRHAEKDAELLCSLAECWAHCDREDKAGDLFRQALSVDAAEPRSLCRYLELQVKHSSSETVVRLAEPMIRNAISRCALQIEGRVNLPNAWGSKAFLHLLVGEPFAALDALAHLLDLCERPAATSQPQHPCAAGRAVSQLQQMLLHIRPIREKLSGFDWLERAVLIGLAVRIGEAAALRELRSMASAGAGAPAFAADDRILILAGGCAPEVEPFMPPFKSALLKGVQGQSFTLITGGTQKGIGGVADAVAGESNGRIRAVGYLPGPIFRALSEARQPGNFGPLFPSAGTDFSPLDPLQGWTDLIASGVDPARVRLLSYAGGSIAKAECALALALGARVGVVINADLPKERQFVDPGWASHKNVLPLPLDAMTLHAFVRIETVALSDGEKKRLEPAARQAHEDYAKAAAPKEPSLLPWDKLDDALKLSNYHQVAYWENVLNEFGLGVRTLADGDTPHEPLNMSEVIGWDKVRKLAEMEHGRWTVERLSRGWRYARDKDIPRRLSPYLIPWQQVPPTIQQYDIDVITGLPKKLREAGLELVRLDAQSAAPLR